MPLLILILALVGIILFLRQNNALVSNNPMPTTQQQMIEAANSAAKAQTQGIQLTQLQAAQIKKFTAIASIAGTATTVGVAALSSLTLAAAGPIGATVAAAIVAIGALRGTAHLVANQWTDGVQKQFNAAFIAITSEYTNSKNDGSVTKSSTSLAIQAIQSLWNAYFTAAEQFAQQDNDHRLVIDQSYCDYIAFRCPPGHVPLGTNGIVNDWIAMMNDDYKKLKV